MKQSPSMPTALCSLWHYVCCILTDINKQTKQLQIYVGRFHCVNLISSSGWGLPSWCGCNGQGEGEMDEQAWPADSSSKALWRSSTDPHQTSSYDSQRGMSNIIKSWLSCSFFSPFIFFFNHRTQYIHLLLSLWNCDLILFLVWRCYSIILARDKVMAATFFFFWVP